MNIQDKLKRGYLFAGMSDEQLSKVAAIAHRTSFGPDEILMREGDPGEDCFVLCSGSVKVMKLTSAGLKTVATRNAGALLGELALLGVEARSATVTAREPTEALRLARDDLTDLLDRERDLGFHFYRELACVLAKRISASTGELAFLMGYGEEHHWART